MSRAGTPASDDGFTLVEMLVAMSVMIVLITVSMSVVVASSGVAKTTIQVQGLNEEARHAINRMARDIRQASSVVTAVNPDGPAYDPARIVAVRFRGDYDGDGCVNGVAITGTPTCLLYASSNPEDLTYCYEPTTDQLYVIDNQVSGVTPVSSTSTSCAGGQPLLAANVAAFKVSYRSGQYRYDTSADGVTTWLELDQGGPPVGDLNGSLGAELPFVDSVILDMTMSVDGFNQTYRSQIDLRNRSE